MNLLLLMFAILPLAINCRYVNDCIPKNWQYSWKRIGQAWFTHTREAGDWTAVSDLCKKIEPGRTSIASVLSPAEHAGIVLDLPNEDWWIGAVRIGGRRFY